MLKKISFLQLFAEPTDEEKALAEAEAKAKLEEDANNLKTFTQAEMDKAISDRLKREKETNATKQAELDKLSKEVQDLKDLSFKGLSEEDRAKKIREEDSKKANDELQTLRNTIIELERSNRNSEILSEFNKDGLPCASEFTPIVSLIANIDDPQQRADMYASISKWAKSIESSTKTELFKNGVPNSSNGDNKDNPFAKLNYTEMVNAIKADKVGAKNLAKASGNWEKHKAMFGE